MVSDATQMLKAAGATDIVLPPEELPPGGFGIHEMGTARMGRDPATSFLNGHNQSHEVCQSLRDGRFVHGIHCCAESVAHVHGADGACRELCRATDEVRRALTRLVAPHALPFKTMSIHHCVVLFQGSHAGVPSSHWLSVNCCTCVPS